VKQSLRVARCDTDTTLPGAKSSSNNDLLIYDGEEEEESASVML
jgi:hypothetical protein